MSKEKSKLEKAADDISWQVKMTNRKINELGSYTYNLNNVLSIIQQQFDKIRNVPSEKKHEYERTKEIRLHWKQQVDKIESDYNSAAKVNVGAGAAGAGLGVGVAALGPTAAMSIATTFGVASTGTAISTLSGAAATNAALAWLGGGTLAAGGSGIAGGSALLALAGPVGWTIAGIAIAGSGLLLWKTTSDKKKLENVFLNIANRDQKKYQLAIVELNERIKRIIDETAKLSSAIVEIGGFGLDYSAMTEQQQYTLGSYVNLMLASSQLLVNPIMGLQPNYTLDDIDIYLSCHYTEWEYRLKKERMVYFANLLYGIETDEKDRALLANSFRNNKTFLKQIKCVKEDIDAKLLNYVDNALRFAYQKRSDSRTSQNAL